MVERVDIPRDVGKSHGRANPDNLVLPGLIDTQIHYPQTQVIASYGAQLMDWLQKYTFVKERKYARPEHAEAGARFFLDELLRNGTDRPGASVRLAGLTRRSTSPRLPR